MSWMTPLKCIGLSSTKNTDRSSNVKSEEADPAADDGACLLNLCRTGDGSTCDNQIWWLNSWLSDLFKESRMTHGSGLKWSQTLYMAGYMSMTYYNSPDQMLRQHCRRRTARRIRGRSAGPQSCHSPQWLGRLLWLHLKIKERLDSSQLEWTLNI